MLGFRVWDIERKDFCKEWFCNQQGIVGDIISLEFNPLGNHERYYPTQSTGLKDATDKEIFVGDILHKKNKVTDKHGNCELFIVSNAFQLHQELDLSKDDISIKIESINIIGNIFESEGFLIGLNNYVFKEFTR